MIRERTFIENKAGHRLSARLELPQDKPRAFGIFAHCFSCTKESLATSRISQKLTQEGIAVLRFDFMGLGESEGEFGDSNFSSNVDDICAVAQFLENKYQAPKLLIGHSLGGAAVLSAAAKLPAVRVVATIGAPSEPAHVQHLFGDHIEVIEQQGSALIKMSGQTLEIQKHFLDDVRSQTLLKQVRRLDKALMIFHSPLDETVGIENAAEIFSAATHPKSFVSLDKADHMLTDREDAAFVAKVISAWAHKYL